MKVMKMFSKRLMPVLSIFTIVGCANIDDIRHISSNPDTTNVVAQIRENRVLKITDNQTFYSPKLVCLGKHINEAGGTRVRISVAPIFDKTGKVYPNNVTAISELVMHSLTKIGAYNVVETPLGYDFSEIRNSFNNEYLTKNSAAMMSNNRLPIGVMLPSDIYVAGSLVQYDDTSEVPQGSSSMSATLNIAQARRNITKVSVGLQLRLIQASKGTVLYIPNVGSASVFLKNELFKSSASANIFKTINSDPFGFDYSVDVADPVQYAVNEIIEKAIYQLFSKFALQSTVNC